MVVKILLKEHQREVTTMNEQELLKRLDKALEENAKIVAKLLVVLRSRNLIKDTDIEFIFNDDLQPIGDDDSLEIE